jgi:hypothetical protein
LSHDLELDTSSSIVFDPYARKQFKRFSVKYSG